MIQRVVVTGSSGYLGSLLVPRLLDQGASVLGIDIQLGKFDSSNYLHVEGDVGNSKIGDEIEEFQPDTIIHAAFVFQPMRNERQMHSTNIGAIENLFQIVSSIKPVRFHVVSSATVYGVAAGTSDRRKEDLPLSSQPISVCR